MPSIHPDYEYDIFISYRQNDNKRDKWVTQFVEALKDELEATLKNEVSIYFDENPHDGLLETHQVDASLAKKLKCLVFIPIVSQTYCDESSFAWEHEFMPFIKMAKEDSLGMNVTLSNGNVASRLLPIKIHDLDTEDQNILEGVLDGPLRSIDFIYGAAGVNRPLRANEDDPGANLNKTFYRDQINKVANALKDIGVSILRSEEIDAYDLPEGNNVDFKTGSTLPIKSSGMKKLLIPLLFVAVLALAFIFLKPILFNEKIDKNISELGLAIMPLKNISEGAEIGFLSFALKDEIHEVLALSKKFAFLSSAQATASYKDKEVTPQIIGDELGVDYVLSGSYQISGDQLNVRVEFSDTQTGNSVWTNKFLVKYEEANIFPMQTEIARKVLAIFNESDEKINADKKSINFASYDHYIKGLEWRQKGYQLETFLQAKSEFEQAISLDSTHTLSWIELIVCKSFLILYMPEERNQFLREFERHLDFLSENHQRWGAELAKGIYQYRALGNYDEGLRHLNNVIEQYPDNETANLFTAAIYKRQMKLGDAHNILLKLISLNPLKVDYWSELNVVYEKNGDYNRKLQAFIRALELGLDSAYYSSIPSMYLKASIPLDSIPAKYRTSTKRNLLNKIYATNNPRLIMEQVKDIPLDQSPGSDNYTKTEYYVDLAISYYVLALDDSASYYANLCITENDKQEEKEPINAGIAMSILGEYEKSQDILKQIFIPDTEDLSQQITRSEYNIWFLVFSKKYAEATEMLIELNRDFPEYGDYFFLTDFIFDRAKNEYPLFAEAVANLKLPPPLVEDNQLERLKY